MPYILVKGDWDAPDGRNILAVFETEGHAEKYKEFASKLSPNVNLYLIDLPFESENPPKENKEEVKPGRTMLYVVNDPVAGETHGIFTTYAKARDYAAANWTEDERESIDIDSHTLDYDCFD